MNDKKRKRNLKKVVRKTYKKYYYPYKSVPKSCPKTEVKYFNKEVDWEILPNSQTGFDITGLIGPGTGRHQRIGDKITVVGVRLRITYRYSTNDAARPHCYIRHFLFWSRIEFNNPQTGGTWFLTNDDSGEEMDVVDRPVNKQVAIPLKDKLFTIGHEKVLNEKSSGSDNYMMVRSTEKSIGKVDYFLKLNKDVYFSAPEKPNPQLVLADCQNSGGQVTVRGLVTLYYIDY